jgi:hypothetical protein
MKTEHIERLVYEENPVDGVWDLLWDVWSSSGADVSDHYGREQASVDLEWTLYQVYRELYTELLPDRCVTEPSLEVPDDGALLVMDAMSVREAGLFVSALDEAGYGTTVDYDYATVPSETMPFRDRVGYNELKKEWDATHISSQNPNITGDERLIWSPYPDTLAESIQEGKTELSSVEEMYEKTEEVLLSLVSQLDADKVVLRSDHGYTRLQSGFGFPISDHHKNLLQDCFSGGRHVSVAETEASELVDAGLVAEADGYYVPVGRFTWPARGKYSTYQHGGLGLTEVLTPKIEVTL